MTSSCCLWVVLLYSCLMQLSVYLSANNLFYKLYTCPLSSTGCKEMNWCRSDSRSHGWGKKNKKCLWLIGQQVFSVALFVQGKQKIAHVYVWPSQNWAQFRGQRVEGVDRRPDKNPLRQVSSDMVNQSRCSRLSAWNSPQPSCRN